jgi:hypothetical protein
MTTDCQLLVLAAKAIGEGVEWVDVVAAIGEQMS